MIKVSTSLWDSARCDGVGGDGPSGGIGPDGMGAASIGQSNNAEPGAASIGAASDAAAAGGAVGGGGKGTGHADDSEQSVAARENPTVGTAVASTAATHGVAPGTALGPGNLGRDRSAAATADDSFGHAGMTVDFSQQAPESMEGVQGQTVGASMSVDPNAPEPDSMSTDIDNDTLGGLGFGALGAQEAADEDTDKTQGRVIGARYSLSPLSQARQTAPALGAIAGMLGVPMAGMISRLARDSNTMSAVGQAPGTLSATGVPGSAVAPARGELSMSGWSPNTAAETESPSIGDLASEAVDGIVGGTVMGAPVGPVAAGVVNGIGFGPFGAVLGPAERGLAESIDAAAQAQGTTIGAVMDKGRAAIAANSPLGAATRADMGTVAAAGFAALGLDAPSNAMGGTLGAQSGRGGAAIGGGFSGPASPDGGPAPGGNQGDLPEQTQPAAIQYGAYVPPPSPFVPPQPIRSLLQQPARRIPRYGTYRAPTFGA